MTGAATTYAIRVEGHLDDHWAAWLGGLDMTRDDDGATTITVQAADQTELHGVLAGLRDIGAVICELRTSPIHRPALTQTIRTERLTLRPARAGDAGRTWRYRHLDSVDEWLAYHNRFTEPVRLATTVIVILGHDDDAPIIGDFLLRRQNARAQLGWVLDPAYTGHGYATEAVRALLRLCFEDLGVRRVTANCFLDDDAACRLMERVGMRREPDAVRESLHGWLDTVAYAILDDEWASTMHSERS